MSNGRPSRWTEPSWSRASDARGEGPRVSPTATESRGTSGAADDPRRPRVGNPSQPSPEERLREADLVERLKQGDEAAFADLVCLHGPRMLAVAKRYVLTESDAEDVLQDALLSAFRAIGSFETKSRLGTWLHTITVNAALMRLRTRRRRPETLVDAGEFEFGASAAGRAAWAFGASEALSRKELRSEVLACLDRLSADFRIVVRLRDMEGMDLAEIGRILDIPVSTVKSRLRRGRAAVRSSLEAHLGTLQS